MRGAPRWQPVAHSAAAPGVGGQRGQREESGLGFKTCVGSRPREEGCGAVWGEVRVGIRFLGPREGRSLLPLVCSTDQREKAPALPSPPSRPPPSPAPPELRTSRVSDPPPAARAWPSRAPRVCLRLPIPEGSVMMGRAIVCFCRRFARTPFPSTSSWRVGVRASLPRHTA